MIRKILKNLLAYKDVIVSGWVDVQIISSDTEVMWNLRINSDILCKDTLYTAKISFLILVS